MSMQEGVWETFGSGFLWSLTPLVVAPVSLGFWIS